MLCPECRLELGRGIAQCPECGATLTQGMPSEASGTEAETGRELVPVFGTADGPLLAIVKGALESADIPFTVQGEGGMRLLPLGRFAVGVSKRVLGAIILVPRARAEEAKDFLRSFEEKGPDREDSGM